MTNNKITKWYKIICNSMGFIVLSASMGIVLVGLWLTFRAFCVDSFIIPTESMAPTLVVTTQHPYRKLLVNKA